MKTYLIGFFVIGMTQLISSNLSAQTIINYQTWTGATGCNIFSSSTAVPATANGNNITVAHQSNIGQPEYSGGSTNAVSLRCFAVVDVNGNTTAYKGTEFRLAYNFQQGYSYEIKINAACINGNSANLRILPNSGGSGTSTQCNGPADIDPNTSGNLYSNRVMSGGTTWTDYTYNYGAFASAQTLLNISAVPPIGSGTQTILIRKITITGTPPTASFTITPSPILVVCGKANPVTLTINNVNNTPGVTGYTWNLGTGNTWIYNGSPAPATITTTTNTLTLSPTCGTTPGSVSATVSVGTLTYPTNTATVSSTNETLSITGPNPLCSGSAVYSIANLPSCGATVTGWAASPSGIVSVTDNGNNTATVTKLADGQVTLSATVNLTNACNTTTVNLTMPLSSGALPVTGYYIIFSDYHQPIQRTLYNNNSPIWLPANKTFGVYTLVTTSGIQSPSWTRSPSSYPFTNSPSGPALNFSGSSGSTAYNQRNGIFDFTANTGCGTTTSTFTWPVIVQGWSFRVSVSPNPVTDNLTVSITDESPEVKALGKNETVTMTLYDMNNTITVKIWTFKNNQAKFNLNISNLKKGHYILKVQKGKYKQSEQIIIE